MNELKCVEVISVRTLSITRVTPTFCVDRVVNVWLSFRTGWAW